MRQTLKVIFVACVLSMFSIGVYAQTTPKVVVIPLFGNDAAAKWRGEWASGAEYKLGDIVGEDGSSYIALIDHEAVVGDLPLETDPQWDLVAASGATGDNGEPGDASTVAGPKGDKGDIGDASIVVGPKGDKGDTGDTGDASTVVGPKGDKGDTGDAGPAPANVVWVAKSGGDHETVGAALAAINATTLDRYLIRIGPGIYNESISLESFVDIEGSGEGITIIRGSGSSSFTGTLNASGAIIAEVRLLSIEAVTATETKAIGINIFNGGVSLSFSDVTVLASGGSSDTYGAYIYNSSPTLSDVILKAVGGTNTRGVFTNLNSSPTLSNVTADASAGTSNVAIYNSNNSSSYLTRVIGTAGAGSTSYGLLNFNNANSTIKDSEFSGITNSLINDGTSSAKVLFSEIDGPVTGAGFKCIGAYTDNFVELNEYCQDTSFLYAIGDTGPAGGKVFYITDGGLHGLEAAPSDLAPATWGCQGTSITGADGIAVGTGGQNTAEIIAGCATPGIIAQRANDFMLGGFSDWFLPSRNEMKLFLDNRALFGITDPPDDDTVEWWVSTESDSSSAETCSLEGPVPFGGDVFPTRVACADGTFFLKFLKGAFAFPGRAIRGF